MTKKGKKTKISAGVGGRQEIRVTPLNSSAEKLRLIFEMMDKGGPFAFTNISGEELDLLLRKKQEWESMTWAKITGERNHHIPVKSLSKEAQDRLFEIDLGETERVFSLHVDGKKRLIGLQDCNLFKVLWWDAEHKVCPSHKKHT